MRLNLPSHGHEDSKNTTAMSPCTPVRPSPVRSCSINNRVSPVPENKVSQVKQLDDLSQILEHVNVKPSCLVAFDIDETIVQTEGAPSHLMTDHGVQEFQRWILGRFPDFHSRNKWCRKLEKCLKTKTLMQSDTAEVIRELQAQGCWVFGLTARFSEMAGMTDKQLEDVGVDLNAHSPFAGRRLLDPVTKGLLRNSIIYCNSQPKGIVLNRFLEMLFRSHLLDPDNTDLMPLPGELVFVDDNFQHVVSVSQDVDCLKKLSIPISSYHYVPKKEQSDYVATYPSDYLLGTQEKETRAILETQMEVFVDEGVILTNAQARERVAERVYSKFMQKLPYKVKMFNVGPIASSPEPRAVANPGSPAKKMRLHSPTSRPANM